MVARAQRIAVFVSMLAVAFVFAVLATQPAWAAERLVGGEISASDVSVAPQDYVYQAAGAETEKYVYAYGITSGKVTYDQATKTLTLSSVKGGASSSVDVQLEGVAITVKLVGTNSFDNLYVYAKPTITGPGSFTGAVRVYKGSAKMKGGTINGPFNVSNGSLAMTGGTINGTVSCYQGTLTMSGGKIVQSGKSTNNLIDAAGFVMKGGSVKSTSANYGIHISGKNNGKLHNFTMSGGSVILTKTAGTGISVYGGNLKMTGGTLKVTGAQKGSAISVGSFEYRNKNYGGKVQIKGGKLYATVAKPADYSAIYADSMTNKLSCLKSITGQLPKGARFVVAKNQYAVTKYNYVKLVKFNKAAKKVTLNKVTYGKHKYSITAIGAAAFKTKNGAKVTSLTVDCYPLRIEKNALYNTKALQKLTFKQTWWQNVYTSDYSKLKSVKVASGNSIAKKAFAKCGKGGGKKLTVVFYKGVYKDYAPKYRALLKSKGMSGSVKIKTL